MTVAVLTSLLRVCLRCFCFVDTTVRALCCRYHCYREVLKGAFVAVFVALALILAILRWGEASFALLLVGFGAMGLFTLPILPGKLVVRSMLLKKGQSCIRAPRAPHATR